MARSILEPFLEAATADPRFEIAGVVDTAKRPPTPFLEKASRLAVRVSDSSADLIPLHPRLDRIAARFGIEVITPPDRKINAPAFTRQLGAGRRADIAISLGCLQIFRPALLACFSQAVNFHNGLLPDYRGLGATGWSLYLGEERSGFAFHRMTVGIDEGAVLVDGAVDVNERSRNSEVEQRKLTLAAELAPQVLDQIDRRLPGRAQSPGEGTYYTAARGRAIRTISDPSAITVGEIRRRLRCFSRLSVLRADGWWDVTRLSDKGSTRIELADGSLGIARAQSLPPQLYRLYRALRK